MIRFSKSVRSVPAMTAATLAVSVLLTSVVSAQRLPLRDETPIASAASAPLDSSELVLSRLVTVHVKGVPLRRALDAIAESARVPVQYYSPILAPYTTPVTVEANQVQLREVLARVLSGTRLTTRVLPGARLGIEAAAVTDLGQGVVIGTVTDAKSKRPIRGATILIDDATKGVMTQDDGTFRLTAPPGQHVVTVRAVGFVKQSRSITVGDDQTLKLDLTMEPSASVLNEVIVTGTVVATERKAIPNPITVITAADIEKQGITRVDQLLRGSVPGVVAIEQGSAVYNPNNLGAMATAKVYSRGNSNVSDGSPNPLKTYVDGVEILDASYLGTIDPQSIERIEIITGPQAATVYGSGAMGGVMQIFTKKGSGNGSLDVVLTARYGTLENNLSPSKAPSHNHGLSVTGGSGPEFTYTGTASYRYTGQWLPNLFNRTTGSSFGVAHTRGALSLTGSVSASMGENGTYAPNVFGPLEVALRESGEWVPTVYVRPSNSRATSSSQTVSLNTDYRMLRIWQHHFTVGKSRTDFGMVPDAPQFTGPPLVDTLYSTSQSGGSRTTLGYNMTLTPDPFGALSSTLTLGATATNGSSTSISGCKASPNASSWIGCYSGGAPTVSVPLDEESWGGFGRWQLGLFDRMYITLGLRGEQNPNYGRTHRVDWTPTNGITYVIEHGDLTVKLLGSYGSATRAPKPDQRVSRVSNYTGYEPSQILSQLENPLLKPEHSRGPEGGIELYYGNVGSLSVNHYRQTISDLIQGITVDSLQVTRISDGALVYITQFRYINVASVRQSGWEGVGSVNLGRFTVKGTYSWMDSRVLASAPSLQRFYPRGKMFTGIPTHTGNVTVSYAAGGTSITVVSNYIGTTLTSGSFGPRSQVANYGPYFARLRMYTSRYNTYTDRYAQPGYVKSDLAMSQRVNGWASLTLNVVNLGNSYGSEGNVHEPALGRQTTMGVSLRFPRR